ncbi:hypothetical protein [Actinomadura viridis]|uniref:Uncharacterized protein n=1 Tax=Actinomadura viridis TaxID=58110 RepID=A0A931DAP5_9ACTN|nr:hypothetical protein [Actinomadura viridis]MBG6087599.1 hypothetical protein [Actinomadura viridis]
MTAQTRVRPGNREPGRRRRPRHAAPSEKAKAKGSPVFVDASGRRARLLRRTGLGAGAALVLYLGAVGVSLVAGADVPLTPWTGSGHGTAEGTRQPTGGERTSQAPRPSDATARTRAPASGGGAGTSRAPVPPSGGTAAPAPEPGGTATAVPGGTRGNGNPTPPGFDRRKKDRPAP